MPNKPIKKQPSLKATVVQSFSCLRNSVRCDLVPLIVQTVNQLVVGGTIVTNVKGGSNVTAVRIIPVRQDPVVHRVVPVGNGIVKGEKYELRNVTWL